MQNPKKPEAYMFYVKVEDGKWTKKVAFELERNQNLGLVVPLFANQNQTIVKFEQLGSVEDRLMTRAIIRRQITSRKSVESGEHDRLADLLEEAAAEIVQLRNELNARI
jgi:hypothetical protein